MRWGSRSLVVGSGAESCGAGPPLVAGPMEQPLAAVLAEPLPGGGPVLEEPPLQPDPMALEVRDGPVVVNPPPCRRGRLGSARWCA